MNQFSDVPPTGGSPSHPHPLAGYGWNAALDAAFAPYAAQGLVPARIARVDRGRCEAVAAVDDRPQAVRAATGGARADTAAAPGSAAAWAAPTAPCTGDWAAVDLAAGTGPVLRALLPRRTAFVRSASSKRSEGQVLAANIDLALIAVSLAAEPDAGRLERFTALAWSSGAQPLLVLTKADLAADAPHQRADAEAAAPGVPVAVVSSATGDGLGELRERLAGRSTALLGQSGAGKSTLGNALLGRAAQRVQENRSADGKGRHTTTTRDLLPLPGPGGGVLIDTPGLRGVGLWDAEAGLGEVFPEIEALAGECRFHDCSHTAEPDCAVLAALDSGLLPPRRWDSYRRLQRENAWLASRSDARLRAEQHREWKRRSAEGRAMMRFKRGG